MKNIDKNLIEFIESQYLLTISTINLDYLPWSCNVYFSSDENLNLFFLSTPNANHSQHIFQEPNIAFTTAWFDKKNLANRKSVQGKGVCSIIDDDNEIKDILKIYNKKFPAFKKAINLENIKTNKIESRPYKITPTYLKFWNDELYGPEGSIEYIL